MQTSRLEQHAQEDAGDRQSCKDPEELHVGVVLPCDRQCCPADGQSDKRRQHLTEGQRRVEMPPEPAQNRKDHVPAGHDQVARPNPPPQGHPKDGEVDEALGQLWMREDSCRRAEILRRIAEGKEGDREDDRRNPSDECPHEQCHHQPKDLDQVGTGGQRPDGGGDGCGCGGERNEACDRPNRYTTARGLADR